MPKLTVRPDIDAMKLCDRLADKSGFVPCRKAI